MRNNILMACCFTAIVTMFGAATLVINAENSFDVLSQTTRTSNTGNGLQMTTTLSKVEAKVGEPVELKIAIKNITKDELRVPGYGLFPLSGIDVRDQLGESVPLTDKGRKYEVGSYFISGQRYVDIQPDKSEEFTIILNDLYQLNAPGIYKITVRRAFQTIQADTKKNSRALSHVLTLRITR